MPSAEDAAAARALEFINAGDEAEETPSSEPEAAVEETPQDAAVEAETLPELEPEVPDDLLAELTDAEIDAQVERELRLNEIDDEEESWGEDERDRLAEERKARLRAEKELQFLRQQHVQSSRAKWEAEAERYFPLADPKAIQAESRRAFLREAKAQHERVLPIVKRERERIMAQVEAEKQAALLAAKEEAKEAWGVPHTTVGATPPKPTPQRERRNGEAAFIEGVKNFMFSGGGD